jgi:tRNA(Ile)-lysidine synthase
MKRAAKLLSRNRYAGRKISAFARSFLREWKRLDLPSENAGVVVAVSGGADSTALLLVFDELVCAKKLKLKLIVAHLDHQLRDTSAADARRVGALAKKLRYPATITKFNVQEKAKKSRDNLEQAARRARYEFLARAATKEHAAMVVTAHTMDDQAETVLLNLIRGSGADGLSGIEAVRLLAENGKTLLVRPLLSWAKRADTERYCRSRGVEFCVDAMNLDERFSRVRVRQQLLPLMQTFNARVVEALSRSADLLREDKHALNGAAERLLELARENSLTNGNASSAVRLNVELLAVAPAAVRRRALRQWIAMGRGDLRRIELAHILAVEGLLAGNRGGRTIELPGGATVSRKRGWLLFNR